MSDPIVELPEWSGGNCRNTRCPGSGKQRILSVEEIEKVYPIKDKFDWWPVPPGTTHVCTVCGFCYEGVSEAYSDRQDPTGPSQIEVDIDEWNWDYNSQFDGTVREAVKAFIRAAPENATVDEIAAGASRYLVGVDPEFSRQVMSGMDDFDKPAITADEFM